MDRFLTTYKAVDFLSGTERTQTGAFRAKPHAKPPRNPYTHLDVTWCPEVAVEIG
jgi:hypothetical protein